MNQARPVCKRAYTHKVVGLVLDQRDNDSNDLVSRSQPHFLTCWKVEESPAGRTDWGRHKQLLSLFGYGLGQRLTPRISASMISSVAD